MNITAPNVKNLTRGGAIIFFAIAGAVGYMDLGNIPDFSASTPTQMLEHKTSRGGTVVMDRREPTEFSMLFKIGIDEYNVNNMQLLFNAATPSAFSQASATAATLNIVSPTLGLSYSLGAFKVTNVVVKVGVTTKTIGVDYALEADLGMVTILPGGSILNSDTVAITYDKPALTGDQIAPLSNQAAISGAVLIFFRSSDGKLWQWKHTTAQLSFSGDTSFTGGSFAKTSAELLIMPDYSQANKFGTKIMLPGA